MNEDIRLPFDLPAVARKNVSAAFDGGRITSDGGVWLLAQAERRLGVADQLARAIPDARDADRVVHLPPDILRSTAATMTGSLAAAAITAKAMPPFHDLDATATILICDLGTAAILVGLGGHLGRRLFSWAALPSPQRSH